MRLKVDRDRPSACVIFETVRESVPSRLNVCPPYVHSLTRWTYSWSVVTFGRSQMLVTDECDDA